MDYILRYPLNKAHYYQRQADAKECIGLYSAALNYRKIALENLKEALTSSSNDDVLENIHLQIIFEEKQIAKVSHLATKSKDSTKLANRGPTINLSNITMASSMDEPSVRLENCAAEILKNTEHIDALVNEMSTTETFQIEDSSSEPAVCTEGPVSDSHSPLVQKPSKMELIDQLKLYNNKNSRLVEEIRAYLMLVLREKLALSNKVKQLEASLTQSSFDTRKSTLTTCSIDEELSELVFSPVEDFAPLDCPPLDFLKGYEERNYSD